MDLFERPSAMGLLAMSVAASISCASSTPALLTPEGARVHVSTASEVAQCRPLGDFIASRPSPRGGMPGYLGSTQVRNAAAAKGATDIVFEDDPQADVIGHGYQCSP
jgi:hypothetical protein